MSSLPVWLREIVRKRANRLCEYCLIDERDLLFPHQPDHIISVQHGGATVEHNLALACIDCNRRKGPNLSSVDPVSSVVVQLFNPRLEIWAAHFRLDGPLVAGLTPAGRATVHLLQMNSEERLRTRRRLWRAQRYGRW